MGFKLDTKTGKWVVWYSRRHPITGTQVSLRRAGFKSIGDAKKGRGSSYCRSRR